MYGAGCRRRLAGWLSKSIFEKNECFLISSTPFLPNLSSGPQHNLNIKSVALADNLASLGIRKVLSQLIT